MKKITLNPFVQARSAIAGVLSLALLFGVSQAQARSVEAIKSSGTITFGVVTDQVPFGFINEKGENDGYDIELTRMMASELGVTAKYVPITAANRIPQLLTGKVDMLVCVLGMYPDRAKVIQYLKPYAAIQTTIYGKKDLQINDLKALAGHTIAVPRASSIDTEVTKVAPEQATIRRFDDDSSAVQALLSGQADLLGGYSHYFAAIDRAQPGVYEGKVTLSTEYLGIAVKPGDKDLAVWGDAFLSRHEADQSINTLYRKWFAADRPAMPESLPGISYATK
jgi:polar amino acid transport system substrate-binding protein